MSGPETWVTKRPYDMVTTWGPNRLFAPNRLNRRSRSMHRRLPSQGKDVTYVSARPVTSVRGRSAVGPVMGIAARRIGL